MLCAQRSGPGAVWLALGLLAAALSVAQAQIPMPPWAKMISAKNKARDVSQAQNKHLVSMANALGQQLDFVLWGDSITFQMGDRYGDLWDQYFGQWAAAPLGVPGSDVEELTYRIMTGAEKFTKGPKVIALLIGINNKFPQDTPAQKLGFLLWWMQTVWPKSRIIVMPPLPSKNRQYIQLRDAYSTMVARHPGVFMSLCGAGLNPTNKQHYRDGVHPVEGGFEILFNCLKGQVAWKLSEYNSRA